AAIRAAEPIDVTNDQIERQRLAIALSAAAAIAIAVLVGLWLSAVLSRPLARLRDAATRLGHGDFTVRAPRSGIAEADAAASALNDTAVRLEELVGRERTFSAHASHQLRTPLASLRLAVEAELAQPRSDATTALEEVLKETDRLEATIDDLLLLARGTAGPGVTGDAESVFSTNARGGHGFGLPLAAALADAEGARLRLARRGPGPVFELAVR